MIKELEKRKDKAMKRSDTDDFWIRIESLQWGSICYLCDKKNWKDGYYLNQKDSFFITNIALSCYLKIIGKEYHKERFVVKY
jgi:hypothetical protein